MNKNTVHVWLERIAAIFLFLSFGIWEIIQPPYWSGFVPAYAAAIVPANTLIVLHGILLTCIGLAFILFTKYIRYVAIVASLVLLMIVIMLLTEFGFSDIVVRDIAILLFTAAMVF